MLCALSHFLDRGNSCTGGSSSNSNGSSADGDDKTDSTTTASASRTLTNNDKGHAGSHVSFTSITYNNNNNNNSNNNNSSSSSNNNNNNNNNSVKHRDSNGKSNFQDGGVFAAASCSSGSGKDYFRHNRRHLPVPHGQYTVGSVDLMCDLSDQGAFFRMYYPTSPTDIHAHHKQWPLWLPRKQYAWGFVLFLKRNKKIFGRLANWLGGDVYVPSLWQAPLLKEDKQYPVVIVSHGIGGNRTYLSSYCTELASHGLVVAALEHRDGSASMTLCLEEQLKSSIRDSNDHFGSDYNLHDSKCKDILNNSCNKGTGTTASSSNDNNNDDGSSSKSSNENVNHNHIEDCDRATDSVDSSRCSISSINKIHGVKKNNDSDNNNDDKNRTKSHTTVDSLNTTHTHEGKVNEKENFHSSHYGNDHTHHSCSSNKHNNNSHTNDNDIESNTSSSNSHSHSNTKSPSKESTSLSSIFSVKKPRLRKCRSAAAALRDYFSDDGGSDNVNSVNSSSSNSSSSSSISVNSNVFRRKSTTTAAVSSTSASSSTWSKSMNRGPPKDVEEAQQEIQFRSWDRRRHKRQRSVRQQVSCSEEWRPFQHITVWDDFDYRNNQMYYRAHEISEVLDDLVAINGGRHINNALGLAFKTAQFKNRLDLSRVAVIGHSFGAASALAALNTDKRFTTGISLDGWLHPLDQGIYDNTQQPTLFLNMEQFQWERNVNQILKFIQAKPQADRPLLTLLGGCHQSCTDFQFLVPHMVGRFLDVCWTLQPELCMATCVTTSLAFLYKQFGLSMEQKHVDALEGKNPHLLVGTNVDLTVPDDGPTPP